MTAYTWPVATYNFSVPADVKAAFDQAFEGQNKSAILTEKMREAVAELELIQRRMRIVEEINATRPNLPPLSEDEFRKLREEGRP
jgi:hypothetical protein